MLRSVLATVIALSMTVFAVYGGLAPLPPMGWRSWNQFGGSCKQDCLMGIADALVDASRKVDGTYMSLKQLGYNTVGLDDSWQACGKGFAPYNYTFHNESGFPLVNAAAFPNMHALTGYIHSLGLRAGWYMDNCGCADVHCNTQECYQGDIDAIKYYGWDDVKVDHCGGERNMTLWGGLAAAVGLDSMIIENCGNGVPSDSYASCPYQVYRISTDIRPTYGSTMNNAQPITIYQAANASGPGCWAYPDMLEVGVTNRKSFKNDSTLSYVEARSHFGLWCVISAPLTLGLNFSDKDTVDSVWDIITNTEALSISQSWAGSPGGLLAHTEETIMLYHCDWKDSNCTLPVSQQWWKPLPNNAAAVIVLNNGNSTLSTAVQFSLFPASVLTCASATDGCNVRDAWQHSDVGKFVGSVPVIVPSHDSKLLVIG